MDEQRLFDRFHAALDVEPPAGAFDRLAKSLATRRNKPSSLPRELALAALLLVVVALLVVGIGRIRALYQTLPAHPSPSIPYSGGPSRSSPPWFVSADVGWTIWSTDASPAGAIFKTTDGGSHWQRQLTLDEGPEGVCLLDVSASDGLYFCRRGSYRTSDGGAHWQRLALPRGNNVQFSFLNPLEAWSVSYVQERPDGSCPLTSCPLMGVFRTTDSGQHWTEVTQFDQAKVFSHGDSLGFLGLLFKDSLSGWFVPSGYAVPVRRPGLHTSIALETEERPGGSKLCR